MKYSRYIIPFICSLTILTVKAQTPEQLKSWLPAVEGWTINDEIEVFNPDNLFDRINGSAPLFIENNFREMTSLEYKKDKDYITLQVYRHASPQDAFGMYASERSSELKNLPIGGEAQGDNANLFFYAGNIYVKMWGNSTKDIEPVINKIGAEFADKIDPKAAYPSIFQLFPPNGKVPYSETYTTSNYIGHEFLKNVYLVKYSRGDKPFQLFVVDGMTTEGAKDILTKYYTFARQALDFKEGAMIIKDRYNGDIPAFWKGQYIIGVFSEDGDAGDVADLLKQMADKLK